MSISCVRMTLGSGKTCGQSLHPKMSVNTQNTAGTSKTRGAEDVDKNINWILPELTEKRIRANLEPLNEQISPLTQLLNQLIQVNSTKTIPTASSCTHRSQTEPSFNKEALEPCPTLL